MHWAPRVGVDTGAAITAIAADGAIPPMVFAAATSPIHVDFSRTVVVRDAQILWKPAPSTTRPTSGDELDASPSSTRSASATKTRLDYWNDLNEGAAPSRPSVPRDTSCAVRRAARPSWTPTST